MKLEFLWIKEYGKVKEMGINFSTNFSFTYSLENKHLSGVKLRDFTSRLYEEYDANITSINAIVGKNGVGKTTILKFLQHNFVSGSGGVHRPCIVCLYDEKTKIYHVYTHEVECNPKSTKDIQFELHNIEMPVGSQSGISISIYQHIEAFKQFTFINYSNFLDLSTDEDELTGSFNLSTNFLTQSAPETYTDGDRTIPVDNISSYRKLEVVKQFRFYISPFIQYIPFRRPDYLTLTVKHLNDNRLIRYLNFSLENEHLSAERRVETENVLQKLRILDKMFDHPLQTDSTIVENRLHRLLIYTYLRHDYFYNFYKIDTIFEKLNRYSDYINGVDFSEKTSIEKCQMFFKSQEISGVKQSIIDLFFELANDIHSLFEQDHYVNDWDNSIVINLSQEKNRDLLINIFEKQSSIFLSEIFDFYWPLSNGEQSLMSLYSRFHDILHKINFSNIELNQNLIILLDEAELGLHPEWQRSFVNDFLNVISQLFKGKNIQIIMTTHSPFVLSDLTLSQVIFMDFDIDKNRSKIIDNPFEEKQSTFAANIHTLLGDSFFMNSGFAGSFVLERIDGVVDRILHENIDTLKKDYDYLDWFINQIGEGIIRNKLIQMLESRMRIDLLNTSTRVDELEERIRKIEHKE